ncbi:hypothetical protein [Aeromonas media]|uniref:hypothetical protein n=1 Tax=Aeromonas media TaxID=651 RepID=UPI00384DC8C1
MSENSAFSTYLAIYKMNNEVKSGYSNATPDAQRAIAVGCALELIRTATAGLGEEALDQCLSSLSFQADRIEAALKVKK